MLSSPWSVACFTLGYLLAAGVAALRVGNSEFLFYIATMLVIIAAVVWAHWRIGFHPLTLWLLSLWGLAHMAGGLVPVGDSVLYNQWLWPGLLRYDHAVHAYGFGTATWVLWQGLVALGVDPRPRFGALLPAMAGAMGFGALNEVVEFAATLALPETNVGGYVNTGWDLVANLAGCVIAALLIRVFRRPERPLAAIAHKPH